MKSKWIKSLIFVFIVVIIDRTVGSVCQKLYNKSNDYNIFRLRYTLDSTKEDILILGSSRAEHHFVPRIISQNIGLSVYNCGLGGEGLLFSLIQLKESLKRYKPKFILVEVSPNVLLDLESKEKLQILKPFYNKDPLIYETLTAGKVFEKVKFLSSIYPYNSTILSLIKGCFKPKTDSLNGFKPLVGIIDTSRLSNKIDIMFPGPTIPSEKFITLKQLIALCCNNNIKIAIVSSPVYQMNKNFDGMMTQIKRMCLQQNKNVYFLDYSRYKSLYKQPVYFKDNLHLNYNGAKIFSEAISKELKEIVSR